MQPTTRKVVEKEEKVVRGTKPVASSKNAVKPKARIKDVEKNFN